MSIIPQLLKNIQLPFPSLMCHLQCGFFTRFRDKTMTAVAQGVTSRQNYVEKKETDFLRPVYKGQNWRSPVLP